MKNTIRHILVLVSIVVLSVSTTFAQYSQSAYFMNDNWQSGMLNPALAPEHGYILLPVIGGTGASIGSSSISVGDLFYANPNGSGLVPFYDVDIDKSSLINSINGSNNINLDFATTIFGVGFHSKKIFWSFGVNLKAFSDISIPKGVFELSALSNDNDVYSIENFNVSLSNYAEAYLGANFKIKDKLSVGVRAKFLMGLNNVEIGYDYFDVALSDTEWKISASGMFNASVMGLELQDEMSGFDFDNLTYNPEFNIMGYGYGLDFGANYDLLSNLSLSFSVTDLGFITWKGDNTISAESSKSYSFSGYNVSDDESQNIFDVDELLHFDSVEGENRRTSLSTKLYAAAEYRFCSDHMALGVLYTANYREGYTKNEVMAIASFRPSDFFTANVSYSFVANQIGAAMNIHPGWINIFVGADYIPTSVTPQYIPISAKNFSFFAGVGIPLARKN